MSDDWLTVRAMYFWQTARPKSQPPPSNRPKPAVQHVIRGDEVEACYSPGGSSGRSDLASGSPSATYSTVNKKSPHKPFHITSYVLHTACMLK